MAVVFSFFATNPRLARAEQPPPFSIVTVPGAMLKAPSSIAPLGASVGDFNNDGLYDLLVHEPLQLFLNQGGYKFLISTNTSANFSNAAAAVADFDGDNDLDIIVSGELGIALDIAYFENLGSAFRASKPAIPAFYRGQFAAADFDGNGSVDLALAGNFTGNAIDAGFGTICFNIPGIGLRNTGYVLPPYNEALVSAADLNSDGAPDLLLAGVDRIGRQLPTLLLTNTHTGAFVTNGIALTPISFPTCAWGDLDNDGDLDLVICGSTPPGPVNGLDRPITKVFFNNNGIFEEKNTGLTPAYGPLLLGDFDNDGDLDIFLLNFPNSGGLSTNSIFLNAGDGTFTKLDVALPRGYRPFAALGDFDGDGDLDIVTSIGTNQIAVIQNNGPSNTPPSVPAGLHSSVSNGDIQFEWLPSTDAQQSA
jgi:hypothetical protein